MNVIMIHRSGEGAGKMEVWSYGNGLSYNIGFGQAGTPMRNIFLEGDDATRFRDEWDAIEADDPDLSTREAILMALDDYL